MAGKNTAAFGIYRNLPELERGVDQLRAAKFRNEDISVLFPDNQGSKDFAHEKHTKAPEGVTTGATTGALLGGALGWLVGVGALAIPGVGPFIAAGPIVAALAGAGAVGAVGGLTGALLEPAYRSTKRSVMKAESRMAAFCSPCTVTARTGPSGPRKFSSAPGRKTWLRLVKPPPTSTNRTNRFRSRENYSWQVGETAPAVLGGLKCAKNKNL